MKIDKVDIVCKIIGGAGVVTALLTWGHLSASVRKRDFDEFSDHNLSVIDYCKLALSDSFNELLYLLKS